MSVRPFGTGDVASPMLDAPLGFHTHGKTRWRLSSRHILDDSAAAARIQQENRRVFPVHVEILTFPTNKMRNKRPDLLLTSS